MRIPAIKGIIDRRILANYRISPDHIRAVLPAPFRPKLYKGWAVGGICLIRLKKIRPKFLPIPWGIGSENAAHRIAVEWDSNGETMQGVYIPRRDTNSWLNNLAGGTIFPGIHYHARFDVHEEETRFSVSMNSDDGNANVQVSGAATKTLPDTSVFPSLEDASAFFEQGALGYSATNRNGTFDGLELNCKNWHVEALNVDKIRSSFFEDSTRFPKGTVEFDCALLMRDIDHEWRGRPHLCCSDNNAATQ